MPPLEFLLTHPVWDVTAHSFPGCRRCVFLLTHPVWDVTRAIWEDYETETFLLTHPVWDVTVFLADLVRVIQRISTHTSRVGCDLICIVLFGCA